VSKMDRRELMAALAGATGLSLLARWCNAFAPAPVINAEPTFARGDRVKIKTGVFAGMHGEVKDLIEAKRLVRVELTISRRPVPVELDYGHIAKA
jgi:transcription antitermination factor NusG